MQQKIIQIGNSLGIIIPKSMLVKVGLKLGDVVDVYIENDKLIISSILRSSKKFDS